jgi:mannose-6-phosphate isomerase-like protein (cupin superfamily)
VSERPGTAPRRVVAAHDQRGEPVFAAVEEAPKLDAGMRMEVWAIWASDGEPRIGDGDPDSLPSFFPGPGGTRVFVSDVPPDGGPVDLAPRMHSTETIDFAFVLSGSLCLTQGDGTEVSLDPGDCVVQTGTEHAWHNPGTEPARVAFVLLGAAAP